ncbi:hypothetical protein CPB84DRAFT_1774604 [Gymnopilus junonius]|uniref:Uncharacterized protein n=1 Tax=Gymnopilus junonius TaxID=109634 RepID=A0A9P5TPJ5_GYMJU|nr:hypothetical protein CPB84DRAFT_1774604 [Gymnopilus junonius]
MDDINPGFMPRTLKPLPLVSNSPSKGAKLKGKMRQSLPTPSKPTGGIFNFFGPNPIIPPRAKPNPNPPVAAKHSHGKASGKRTLAEVMDQDLERKKKHRTSPPAVNSTQSRFFHTNAGAKASSVQRRHSDGVIGVAGPSRLYSLSADKENVHNMVGDTDEEMAETSEPELDGSDLSLRAQFGNDPDRGKELNEDDFPDAVQQDDGYISPSPSYSKDVQDLSSPPGYCSRRTDQEMQPTGMIPSDNELDDDSFGADAISSPISMKIALGRQYSYQTYQTPSSWTGVQNGRDGDNGKVLVQATPTPTKKSGLYPNIDEVPSPTLYRGPDLRTFLGDDGATELEDVDLGQLSKGRSGTTSGLTSPPSPSPETPDSLEYIRQQFVMKTGVGVDDFDFEIDDEETRQAQQISENVKAVMDGWRQKFAWQPAPKTVSNKEPCPPQQLQKTTTPSHHGLISPKKTKIFTPGARPTQSSNLKRSNAMPNITPAGRQWKVTPYIPPKSAPSKLPNTSGTGLDVKSLSRRSLFRDTTTVVTSTATGTTTSVHAQRSRQLIDLTLDDDIDDIVPTSRRPNSARVSVQHGQASASMRLAQFR